MSKPLILIVEDDDATAECLTDLLRAEGYDTEALSAPGSVEAVRSLRPSLMLLDLIFPESTGEDLLRALRRDRDMGQLPVLLLSAVPRLEDLAAKLPVQGYVSKPFDVDHLLTTIANLMPGPSPQTEPALRWGPRGLAVNR